MNVRPIMPDEVSMYDQLAVKSGSVFYQSCWATLHGDRLIRYGIFDKLDRLQGGFQLFRQRLWGLTIFRNAPFTPFSGPFLTNGKKKNPVAILEEKRKLLNAMAGFLDKKSYALLFISFDRHIEDILPFYWRGFKVIPGYTYIVDLKKSIDNIWKDMSQTRRNDISKAKRDGLEARLITDRNAIYSLVCGTFDRKDKELDTHTLQNILFKYANKQNSYAFITYKEDRPLACCFVIIGGDIAYYLLGGYNYVEKHHGAGALAIISAIEYAKFLGMRWFDFEGSVIQPIERFFRGFGGCLTPYFTLNKGWLPVEMTLKLYKRSIF